VSAGRHARRGWPERLSLLAVDVAAFVAGLWLAQRWQTAARSDFQPPPPTADSTAFGLLVLVQVLVLTLVFFFQRLYHQPRGVSRLDLAGRLLRGVSVGIVLALGVMLGLASAGVALPRLPAAPIDPVYLWLATLAAVLVGRGLHRALWNGLRRAGIGRDRVLVVGAGPVAQDLIVRIQRRPWLGYQLVGLVDDAPGRERARGVPVVGRTEALGELVERLDVDEVMIALPEASHERLLDLVSRCQRDGLAIKVFPDVFQILASEVQIGDLDGLPLLTMRDTALRGWRLTLKRLVDLAGSALAVVLLSPILVALALLVKLESRGPAFFVQERMGLDGRPFPMLKLRSMRADAESGSGPVWTKRDDPRATRLGRLLRRTNLDELPQLINVLLGHMSLVGPRPERPAFVAEFRTHVPRYMERHRMKAGLTGWAAVNGLRGDTSIEERTKYDLYYIENWSLLFDFKIMALTALHSFRDPNAY
jgi:exopolysaccharide biosynthesis polyprenyl glycosylphosphotransferase